MEGENVIYIYVIKKVKCPYSVCFWGRKIHHSLLCHWEGENVVNVCVIIKSEMSFLCVLLGMVKMSLLIMSLGG